MEYIYAALILHESDAEINEEHLTSVLEAANVDVEESRVKALVAALEDVDVEEALEEAAFAPAAGAPAEAGGAAVEEEPEEEAEAEEEEPEEEAEDEDEASGEGLGELFG
jgi:large subunit ribosomal protein L12